MSVDEPGDEPGATRYDAFADYQSVSQSVARSIDQAVEAWAHIHSLHAADQRVPGHEAAEAAARLLTAATKLQPELEQDRDRVDTYDDILGAWEGEEGYIEQLKATSFERGCPEWTHEFVLQIRRAGWHLGYLQAGRQESDEDEDWVEGPVDKMLNDL
jgi:hypothetical protein